MPEVTVIMPAYNAMPYLVEAVRSILSQTLKDFSFIIVNDGSTDETEKYLNQLTDPRVQVIHQPNRGQGAAKNAGLDLIRTEFVAMMDADDVSYPARLEKQLHFLRQHEEVGMVGTKVVYLSPRGRKGFSPPMPCDHETIYADLMRGRHAMGLACLMCRTSILKKVGGFRVDGSGEDLDMWLRVGEVSKMANLDEILLAVRLHFLSVNVRHQAEIRARYAHSRHSAKRRAERQPELSYAEFLALYRARPFWQQWAETLDIYSNSQYRRALVEILDNNLARGYTRLAWAALCSPPRSIQRIFRVVRKYRKV